MTLQAHLITVGVISAQKKMLSVLTAWEENMPMIEKATENFLFRVSRRTAQEWTKKREYTQKTQWQTQKTANLTYNKEVHILYLCHDVGCISQSLDSISEHWRIDERRMCYYLAQENAQFWLKTSITYTARRRTTEVWNNDLCTLYVGQKWRMRKGFYWAESWIWLQREEVVHYVWVWLS